MVEMANPAAAPLVPYVAAIVAAKAVEVSKRYASLLWDM